MERRGLLRGAAVRLLAALGAAVLCLSAIPAEAAVGGQVADAGGTREAAEDGVTVGKTIAATELENVFDITLTVETGSDISVTYRDPDMAVVIVMDISNTMKYAFDGTSRYLAAIGAAGRFLERFAAETGSASRVGLVAFNTHAHEIFSLQSCGGDAERLKHRMEDDTWSIIGGDDYKTDPERYTNMEAGLRMAGDMLREVPNRSKFIVLLSDGFPTTYLRGEYTGYEPKSTGGTPGADGVFYDSVRGLYCLYGSSYSDKAAIRAREEAERLKSEGITLFSIGVAIGDQTVRGFVEQTAGQNYSVVDRTGESYEIGGADDPDAYRAWLRSGIGSGYYYDSGDQAGLVAAYDEIFARIKETVARETAAVWVTEDPLPAMQAAAYAEFVGLFAQDGSLTGAELTGAGEPGAENSAAYDVQRCTIRWDLKNSGYTETGDGEVRRYAYRLCYRVRLKNEAAGFSETAVYPTNDTTTLTYRCAMTRDGQTVIGEDRTIDFPIPAVVGYLTRLSFRKVDQYGRALSGAKFALTHRADCSACRGDGSRVPLQVYQAQSDMAGTVCFSAIPSGHLYMLEETDAPPGCRPADEQWYVTAAYGSLTVTPTGGESAAWDLESNPAVVNQALPTLPETGGTGDGIFFLLGGGLCISAAAAIVFLRRERP